MIPPVKKLKLGLSVAILLLGFSTLVTNNQLLTFYEINIGEPILGFIYDLQIAAFLLLLVVTYRLWKYHELCKECYVQKEMVKELKE